MRTRTAARVGLALALLSSGCRRPPPPPPVAAKTADGALVELSPEEFPAFGDDLGLAGLDLALDRSLAWIARIRAADPSRTFAFGRERVPAAKLEASLARFRALVAARTPPAELDAAIRREFRVFRSIGDGTGSVLFTGYYLPELRASPVRTPAHPVPLHRAPADLVIARQRDFPSDLAGDLVGRVVDGRLVPYPTRAEIARGAVPPEEALAWVDSAVDAFFAEVQGSALLRYDDGTTRVATYAGKNGHRYEAVGNELLRRGALQPGQVSMQSIRAWLAANPAEQDAVLAANPSYVFFRLADDATGALGQPVTTDRTIAADARVFPKGALAFVETARLAEDGSGAFRPFSRFVLDQDSGGAIRTSARVDLFFGAGTYAAEAAGRMKQPGRLYYLLLR
jgi:membrane-bound lytic murein transglycosylase A